MSIQRPSSWRFAAIVYCKSDDVSAALALTVGHVRRTGLRLGGLMQRFGAEIAPGKREMLVEVLHSGEVIRLHDPRGRGVMGCMLDSDGLARAAMAFRTAAMSRPDLLLAGRFGKQEVAGTGLRAELAEALISGVPVLVPVRTDHFGPWQNFVGGPTEVLAPEPRAILEWADLHGRLPTDSTRRVLPTRQPIGSLLPLGRVTP